MKKTFFILIFILTSQITTAQIVINELDCDTPGIDDREFIELKSDTPSFSLNGYVLVLFNGSTSGGDSSYYSLDLDPYTTDENGLLLIGSITVTPFPQAIIPANLIQQGADAVAIYLGDDTDFPDETLATTTNIVDALVYDTSDPDDVNLMNLLGVTQQINEDENGNKTTESIQLNNDGVNYTVKEPTPRALNFGGGIIFNPISISTSQTMYDEGESFDITFTAETNITSDYTFSFTLNNGNFNNSDFSGSTTVTIPNGENSVITTITLTDDVIDEGDEEMIIQFSNLSSPFIPFNNYITIRVVDNDFVVAPFGTPTNPTYGIVESTQPTNYYDSLDGLSETNLEQAIQNIIAEEGVVRAQTYADVIDILKEADQNPANSNQVWLVYTEQGRPKLDFQTTSSNVGKWNREHTFPRSLAGYYSIDDDDFPDGINVYWNTTADSLRHGNSDAHALRAADGPENSARGNQHYGQYNGPSGNLGSFKGDVARGVLYMQIRYNGLQIVNSFPSITGQMGDLSTILDWHRNDPPDDFEMNRNNTIYNWQFNRNPFIDHPDLVEYIWGTEVGNPWSLPLGIEDKAITNIQVYPNPTTNKIFVKGLSEEAIVEVFSIDGRKIITKKINNNSEINLQVESGMYLLVNSTENKQMVKKIIVN